jgi:hypothetical protein
VPGVVSAARALLHLDEQGEMMRLRNGVLILVTVGLSLAATRASETPRDVAVAAMVAAAPAPGPRQVLIHRSLHTLARDPFDEKDIALGVLLLFASEHNAHGR